MAKPSRRDQKPKGRAKTHWERPSHFIGSNECRFGLTDVVGEYIISTVGDYHPTIGFGRTEIGLNRFYETMVFTDSGIRCKIKSCDCGGIPKPSDYMELDCDGYQTEAEARAGHAAMVKRYGGTPYSEQETPRKTSWEVLLDEDL
jgi:hypothetical protein